MAELEARLRKLPGVDQLATVIDVVGLTRAQRVAIARTAIDLARHEIMEGGDPDSTALASKMAQGVALSRPRKVINATGVLLHTNLGRAPLSARATAASALAAGSYSNTELDLESGERGRRGSYATHLLQILTDAEDAIIVNNNAAALQLILSALASGLAVPVSRGELIEIGGSYRLPDVMAASGATVVEVGTTNKTRVQDYETALQIHDCGALLKVHTANYEITGFVASAPIEDLVPLARRHGVPLIYDIGSGLLDASAPWLPEPPPWLEGEPGVRQAIGAGANIVSFSGDKLLGGPQAGVIVGGHDLIDRLRAHPLARALRVGAPVDAALAATLEHYVDGTVEDIPFWGMATADRQGLTERAERLAAATGGVVENGVGMIGGGSAPSVRIATVVVRFPRAGRAFEPLLGAEIPVL
ncbi:MAG: L-seryl-tRNA(Sec) selenium transferase, partial [Acidimicrobiia bacterium]|nr:L-seryl-tRNA(Sec) selenium transferase [Acidimicrobiia bacterium]